MELIGDLERLFATSLYPLRVPLFIGGLVLVLLVGWTARRRGWLNSARAHPGRSVAVIVPVLAVSIPLGWYLASPLFITTRVDEAPPVAAGTTESARLAGIPSPSLMESLAAASRVGASPAAASPADPTAEAQGVTTAAGPAKRLGTFQGNDDFHFGRGTARVVVSGRDVFIRLEDFAVRNGPDLYVYLSPVSVGYAANGINLELGRLRASEGNQNYKLPQGTNADDYRSVVIWCKQFGVQFAVAALKGS